VFHNAPFDIAVLAKAFPALADELRWAVKQGLIRDTRIMYALRRPERDIPRSLAAACKEVLGIEVEKGSVRTSFKPGVPLTNEQYDYAAQDAEVTYDLHRALEEIPFGGLCRRPEFFTQHEIKAAPNHTPLDADRVYSSAAAWMAFEIEPRGLGVDIPVLKGFHAEAEEKAKGLMNQLVEAGLAQWRRKPGAAIGDIDVASFKKGIGKLCSLGRRWTWQGGEVMVRKWKGEYQQVPAQASLNNTALRAEYSAAAQALGLEPPVSEKTKALSMEYDFWKQYREDLPQTLQVHLELGKQRKLLSTYFQPLLDKVREVPSAQFSAPLERDYEKLTVHPNMSVAFAETARWSCWRPNLQNQPKSIRGMYRAPYEGHVLVSADYKSLEMYTACQAMHRLGITGPLRKLLDEGGDTHQSTADLTGITRQEAKIANFGLLGGMGGRTFLKYARGMGMDWRLSDADRVRTRWLETFWDCAEFLQLFKIDPWNLMPDTMRRRGWLELNKIEPDNGEFVTRWELGRKLNEGRIYVCTLPTGRTIPNRRFAQAANIFFQGLGADVISLAYHHACCHRLQVCVVVHDSITITASKQEAENAGRVLADCMQQALSTVVDCGVEIPTPGFEIGEHWS
jgi:hypothetical protein